VQGPSTCDGRSTTRACMRARACAVGVMNTCSKAANACFFFVRLPSQSNAEKASAYITSSISAPPTKAAAQLASSCDDFSWRSAGNSTWMRADSARW